MGLFRMVYPVFMAGIIFVLSGCVVDSPTGEIEPVLTENEVNGSAAAPEEKEDIVVPIEETTIKPVPEIEPTTSDPFKKEGTTNQIPVTLVSTTDGLSP